MRRWFVGFLLCFLGIAWAQQELMEIIPLRAKTPDEVIPVLSPLLEPGATLTGANNQLILRASKRNRDDLKRALAAIDVPARNLIIHVSLSRDADTLHQGGVASGKVVVGTKSRVEGNARVWDTRSQSQESGSQMIRAIEGGREDALYLAAVEGLYALQGEEPLLADWISETLRIPCGKVLFYRHMDFMTVYEEELFITIEKGRVTERRVVDHRGRTPEDFIPRPPVA